MRFFQRVHLQTVFVPVSPHQSDYRLAWIGAEAGPCDNLLEQFVCGCDRLKIHPRIERLSDLDWDRLHQCDRIVLTCNNRAYYPDREVEALTTTGTITPWGVVTGSWHAGSRRSGQGIVTHWQQPWFKWWDSWMGWFFPEMARPGSLVTNAFASVVVPLDYALPGGMGGQPDCKRQLAIVSACRQTADLLTRQSQYAGWSALTYASWSECQHAIGDSSNAKPEVIVWDDSLLPCLPGVELNEAVEQLLCQIQQHIESWDQHPKIVASIGLENIHVWSALSRRGCVDMLVKPSAALGLSNYLFSLSQRQVA